MFTLFEKKLWTLVFGVSFVAHLLMMSYLEAASRDRFVVEKKKPIHIKIAVIEKKAEVVVPPKVEKLKKPKKKKAKKKHASLKKAIARETPKDVQPIQGLTKDSFVKKNGSGFKASVGNSLMVPDSGIRVDKVEELAVDMSADAKLIQGSIKKPNYTDDALDVGLEGLFIIDVFVDKLGEVIDAELRKKIGYGMDKRILKSVATAKFVPRKNSMGSSIKGWAVIKFRLAIP